MKKLTFGNPEKYVPSMFCDGFNDAADSGARDLHYDTSRITFRKNARGCVLEIPISEGTRIYGFGLQLKRAEHSGNHVVTRVNADPVSPNGEGHAPVPFFVTNKGWGMYFDTARFAEFDCGKIRNGSTTAQDSGTLTTSTDALYAARRIYGESLITVQIPAAGGITVYVFGGETMTEIVSQYNMLSGGGCRVPEWGLGVLYRCCASYNAEQVKAMADCFREADIPCDILGLEPGWQTHAYSCSYLWDKEKFPNPAELISYLKSKDYHINLWEHAFTHPTAPIYNEIRSMSCNYEVWGGLVPDFAVPECAEIFAASQHDSLVAHGIDSFKLDECDNSDNTGGWSFPLCSEFPSGLDGEQYHSLFGTLYAKTMLKAIGSSDTLSEVRNLGALAASYPFVLYSDLYEHRDFVRGVVTAGYAGLLWSPELRDAKSEKDLLRRLQSVVFSVQCLINAWYCDEVPWHSFGKECEDKVRALLQLRKTLVPMLKDAFDTYSRTGKPPIRSLAMDFTDDENTYDIDDAYMFCDNLLVAPIIGTDTDTREVYLPPLPNEKWVDYFTGADAASGKFSVTTDGIPVYMRVKL